jgi:hypothetical protein
VSNPVTKDIKIKGWIMFKDELPARMGGQNKNPNDLTLHSPIKQEHQEAAYIMRDRKR